MRREITDGGRESLYALLARALERVTEGLSGAADTPATLRRALAAMCAVVLEDPGFASGDAEALALASKYFSGLKPPPLALFADVCDRLLDARLSRVAGRLKLGRPRTARRSGSVYTPASYAEKLAKLALRGAPPGPLRVLDPACGTGNLLVAVIHELRLRGEPLGVIAGIDLDPLALGLARHRLRELIGHEPQLLLHDSLSELPATTSEAAWDVVVANPPWIAYAGRASLGLSDERRAAYRARFESFRSYPTAHGMFAERCAELLRPGGRLALLLPSSVADLQGYAPTRVALSRRLELDPDLESFGDGAFPGVFQPSLLVGATARQTALGPLDGATAAPWQLPQPGLTDADAALLRYISVLPKFPPECFGERGLQAPRGTAWLSQGPRRAAVREGKDISSFAAAPPRRYAPASVTLGAPGRWAAVSVLIRQTARYPVAAPSDGLAFRNSLLAGFSHPEWPAARLIALLNSGLLRWYHYHSVRDAREGIPQVKVAHLRSLPAPPPGGAWSALDGLANEILERPKKTVDRLDDAVAALYGLDAEAAARVKGWHRKILGLTAVLPRSELLGPPAVPGSGSGAG